MVDQTWELLSSMNATSRSDLFGHTGSIDGYLVVVAGSAGVMFPKLPFVSYTGGDPMLVFKAVCDWGGSGSPVIASSEAPANVLPVHREPREALELIQTAFGLSITTLAAVLRVERPTIYSWLKSTATPSLANSERISRVAELADIWLAVGNGRPVVDVRAAALGHKSLLELLSEEHLRTFATETALRSLAKRLANDDSPRRPLRDIARRHAAKADGSEYDALTGKRSTLED